MTAWEVVRRAAAERLPGLTLHAGLGERERAELEARLGGPLPADVRELVDHCRGLDAAGLERELTFDRPDFGLETLFPRSVALTADGCGNFWIVDVDPGTGRWGKVFFACHDPPALALQAMDLAAFLEQALDAGRPGRPQTLQQVSGDGVFELWRRDPFLVDRGAAMTSGDPILSRFASELPEGYRVADLRTAGVGAGFALLGHPELIRRCGRELVFGVPPRKPSLLARLLGRG